MKKNFNLFILLSLVFVSCSSVNMTQLTKSPIDNRSSKTNDYCFSKALDYKTKNDKSSAYDLFEFTIERDSDFAASYNELFNFKIQSYDIAGALDMIKKASSIEPENIWFQYRLANLYSSIDSVVPALKVYESISSMEDNKVSFLYNQYNLYIRNDDFQNAIKTLDLLEDKTGETQELIVEKVKTFVSSGDSQKAVALLKSKIAKEPDNVVYKQLLADLYANEKKYSEATALYDDVLKTDPYDSDANFSLLIVYRLSDSAAYKNKISELVSDTNYEVPLKVNVLKMLLSDDTLNKDSVYVEGVFDNAVKYSPESDTDILLMYSGYLESITDNDRLINTLNDILKRNPANEIANYHLLRLYVERSETDNIMAVTENAVKYLPDELLYYFYLSVCYLEKGNNDKALEVSLEATKHISDKTDTNLASQIYSIIGDTYYEKGKIDEAYKAYDKALEYDADNTSVLNNYAYFISVKGGDLMKAEDMIAKAIRIRPDDVTMLDTYAWVLFVKQNYPLAKTYIDKVLSLDSEPGAVILEHAGDIYMMNGDVDEAVDFWKKAVEAGSESATIKEKIKLKKYIKGSE